MPNRSETFFNKYAIDVADSNNKNANKDYSITPAEFEISMPSGAVRLVISRLLVYIEDTGSFDSGRYGNSEVLTNGIDILIEKNGVETSLLDGELITQNGHWGKLCYDVDIHTWGSGNEFLVVRWTFAKSGISLSVQNTDRIIVRCSDDLTDLVAQTFLFQGYSDVDNI